MNPTSGRMCCMPGKYLIKSIYEKVIVYEIVVDSDIEAAKIISEIESTTGMTPARIIDADVSCSPD